MGGSQISKDELIAVLRLQNIPNIGDVIAKRLITHCGSPAAIFSDKVQNLLKIDGIGTYVLRGLHDHEHLEAAQAEYQYIKENNLLHLDKQYLLLTA